MIACVYKLKRFFGDGLLDFTDIIDDETFDLKRLFIISNVPKNQVRGNHASLSSSFLFYCSNGSLSLEFSDGNSIEHHLLTPESGVLLIHPMIWVKACDFSVDGKLVVLASKPYKKSDYINDYDLFIKLRRVYEKNRNHRSE